ncbi:MAG: hypothetical protein WBJ30_08430 [Tepidanaerobacteraceae bacterium]
MSKKKLAFVTLGDTRLEFYKKREHIVKEESQKLFDILKDRYELYVPETVFNIEEGQKVADEIRSRGISAVIIHLPIWATPNLAFRVAYSTDKPVLLVGNKRQDSSSLVTMLAIAGMLDQTGKECYRLLVDVNNAKDLDEIDVFVSACYLVDELARSSYCLLGGRSIGIGTTVADPSQWQSLFGVEFDHKDQYEIVYRSKTYSDEKVAFYKDWINKAFKVDFGELFSEETLDLQIRSYLALKDIVKENHYNFLGIKCQTDMSDHFVLQCLPIALLNNNYDAEGPKEVIPTACEADCDGALTMKLLSIASGNNPSNLVDIRHFDADKKELILANCGSVAPFFSKPSSNGDDYSTTLMPHVFGKAGGGSLQMIAKEGKVTIARLFRSKGKYVMGCFEAELESRPIEELKKTTWCFPHEFVKADIDYDKFFRTMNSNHLHTVYGSYGKVLELFCKMKGIEFINYNA